MPASPTDHGTHCLNPDTCNPDKKDSAGNVIGCLCRCLGCAAYVVETDWGNTEVDRYYSHRETTAAHRTKGGAGAVGRAVQRDKDGRRG